MKVKTTLKSVLFYTIISFFYVNMCYSQSSEIKLIGFNYSSEEGTSIVEWNAGSTTFSTITPTNVQGILVGSSTFDSKRSNYFAKVLDNTTGEIENILFKYNTNSDTVSLFPINSFFNGGSEVDMETGFVYTYDGDDNNNVYLNKYDPITGIATNLGFFNFPESTGFFPDSTCYDTNSKMYYFLILDGLEVKLVSASVLSQPFSYTITSLVGYDNTGNVGLEFSNEANTIYAMYPTINQTTGNYALNIGTLNPILGQFSLLVNLENVIGYQLSNRTYDQENETFLFVGVNSTNDYNLYAINTTNSLVEVLPFPDGNVNEIECDNSLYAMEKYGVLSLNENNKDRISLYPNPSSTYFQVNFEGGLSDYSITDLLGKTIQSGSIENQNRIDVSNFTKGIYIFSMVLNDSYFTKKIIVE